MKKIIIQSIAIIFMVVLISCDIGTQGAVSSGTDTSGGNTSTPINNSNEGSNSSNSNNSSNSGDTGDSGSSNNICSKTTPPEVTTLSNQAGPEFVFIFDEPIEIIPNALAKINSVGTTETDPIRGATTANSPPSTTEINDAISTDYSTGSSFDFGHVYVYENVLLVLGMRATGRYAGQLMTSNTGDAKIAVIDAGVVRGKESCQENEATATPLISDTLQVMNAQILKIVATSNTEILLYFDHLVQYDYSGIRAFSTTDYTLKSASIEAETLNGTERTVTARTLATQAEIEVADPNGTVAGIFTGRKLYDSSDKNWGYVLKLTANAIPSGDYVALTEVITNVVVNSFNSPNAAVTNGTLTTQVP